jgi:hypothetical protein
VLTVTPPADAEIVTSTLFGLRCGTEVAIVNEAEVCPAPTTTDWGSVAIPAELLRVTVSGSTGCGALIVTTPELLSPNSIVSSDNSSDCGVPGGPGIDRTLRLQEAKPIPRDWAKIVVSKGPSRLGMVGIGKETDLAPEGIVTSGGGSAAEGVGPKLPELDMLILSPPVGASLCIETVPFVLCPVMTLVGLTDT